MKKFACKAMALSVLAVGSTGAMAEEQKTSIAGFSISGDIAATTDYRFRGVTQSSNNPAIQGGFTVNHESGAYLTLWGSSVDFGIDGNSTETDATLGYASSFKVSPAYSVGYDVGVTYYGYIGAKSNFTNPYNDKTGLNFTELYAKLIFADALFKGDSITTGVNYSPDYWGRTDDFWYFNVGYSAPIADTGFTGLASVGYNKLKNNDALSVVAGGPGKDDDYIDYKFGVSYELLGVTAELAGVGTNISTSGMTDSDKKPYDLGAVFTLSKSF
ncbi:TorF family putative porin [Acinetobacter sp. WZC-1]|uniref:TorF family putative porin n=1 Tax=Acinetobacter sp. WZC-1 TaxID=3459034 RepID=UPI00403D9153